ncbi:ABC transporter ATP-binding protein [Limnohabitans sp.]|jgi:branched-chain amino acid transport system ATP-binding protein|uniref:ABC transporter ATP-binding protein n=1 Tax=Limnohabitans sp. TaxID=1907725 RepID=UPI0037C07C06
MDQVSQHVASTSVQGAEVVFRCEGVSKHFGSLTAVDNFSIEVAAGSVLGIGGPNGAGKTTFFDVVTGVSAASSGRVWLGEQDISDLSADRICQLGIARTFQLNATFEGMTVRENVQVAACYGQAKRVLPPWRLDLATQANVTQSLEFVGLSHKANQVASSLTVLERKLLMLAGAMATQPRVLFLDEPVGGLAADEIDQIMGLVKQIKATGVTIVLIEHVMRFLLELSDTVIIMHHGGKLFEGLPQDVAKDPTVVDTYLGDGTSQRLNQYFQRRQHASP